MKILSFLKSTVKYFLEPKDPLEREIFRLHCAISRTETKMDALMESVKHVCGCCRYAALGGIGSEYDKLCDKLERQEFWLKKLRKKHSVVISSSSQE